MLDYSSFGLDLTKLKQRTIDDGEGEPYQIYSFFDACKHLGIINPRTVAYNFCKELHFPVSHINDNFYVDVDELNYLLLFANNETGAMFRRWLVYKGLSYLQQSNKLFEYVWASPYNNVGWSEHRNYVAAMKNLGVDIK